VSPVEGRDRVLPESLSQSNQAGIGSAQWKICVLCYQISDSGEVLIGQYVDSEITICDRSKEPGFGLDIDPPADQVSGLGHHQRRCAEWPNRALQKSGASLMVSVRRIGSCDERTGIDD